MKLGRQIEIVAFLIPSVLVISAIMAGSVAINSVLMNLHGVRLTKDSELIMSLINSEYKVLNDAGVAELPHYIDVTQRGLFDEFYKNKMTIHGDIVILSNEQDIIMSTMGLAAAGLFSQVKSLSDTKNVVKLNNERYLCFTELFEPWQWQVFIVLKEDLVYVERDQFLKRTAGFVIIILIFGLMFSYKMSKNFKSGVSDIINCMHKLEEGDFSVTATGQSSIDEIKILQSGFNTMIHTIVERSEKLDEYRDHLEELVLERTQQLEHSNSDLEQFATVASHDLQEPLRKITAFGSRLEPKLRERNIADEMESLGQMMDSAGRMKRLIQDLLAYSRISSTGHTNENCKLDDVINNVLVDLEENISRTGTVIDVGDLPEPRADSIQMYQLLQNLILNAIIYVASDVVPRIEISGSNDAEAKSCNICIKDNGIGFDEQYADQIFSIFQRLHSKHQYEGTGIGLAICHKIVRRQNGSITVKSQPGFGSTFTITLPL